MFVFTLLKVSTSISYLFPLLCLLKAKQKLNQNRLLSSNAYNPQTNSASTTKKEKKSLKKTSSDDNIKNKNKTSQASDIINMKINTFLEKYSNNKATPTATTSSSEKRTAKAHLDFYTNEEFTDDEANGENGSISGSSSSSSSYQNDENIKEAIRRAAEATNSLSSNRLSSSNLKRVTIDLSNDPDIRKYFESTMDDEEVAEEDALDDVDLDKTLNLNITEPKTTVRVVNEMPLIDIYDEAAASLDQTAASSKVILI